jgi:hypothetical protein
MVNRKNFLYIAGIVGNLRRRSAGGPFPGRITEVPSMFDLFLSRLMLRAVSVVLGGIGMFHLFLSFKVPDLAGNAFVLIAAAGAIAYFCED